jgi:hypothetical protein
MLWPFAALQAAPTNVSPQQIVVSLPSEIPGDASGRLLVFASPADPGALTPPKEVDSSEIRPSEVAVAGRDVNTVGADRKVAIDLDQSSSPSAFSSLVAGNYWVQVVLDRNRDYARYGRGPGDIVSKVIQLRLPLEGAVTVDLDHALPDPLPTELPASDQARLSAAQPYLNDVAIRSSSLSRFWGRDVSMRAWVLVPPGYLSQGRRTWPVVYLSGAYSSNHSRDLDLVSRIAELNRAGALPPMIWVVLDFSTETGTTQFVDSVNNGPWGTALTKEFIPALERRFRMDARPSGRFLIGQSSGGWASIWLQVRYPGTFGGAWGTAPDPSDFHNFVGVDLYAPNANMYYNSDGSLHPLVRVHGQVTATIRDWVRSEDVLGDVGPVFRSYDWDFSPRGPDGRPVPMFNHVTGAIDPNVATYWRNHYDVARLIEALPETEKHLLNGKLHVVVGTQDTYYLDGSAHLLKSVTERAGIDADFKFMEGKNHNDLYRRDSDPWALLKDIARAMYSKARPTG